MQSIEKMELIKQRAHTTRAKENRVEEERKTHHRDDDVKREFEYNFFRVILWRYCYFIYDCRRGYDDLNPINNLISYWHNASHRRLRCRIVFLILRNGFETYVRRSRGSDFRQLLTSFFLIESIRVYTIFPTKFVIATGNNLIIMASVNFFLIFWRRFSGYCYFNVPFCDKNNNKFMQDAPTLNTYWPASWRSRYYNNVLALL